MFASTRNILRKSLSRRKRCIQPDSDFKIRTRGTRKLACGALMVWVLVAAGSACGPKMIIRDGKLVPLEQVAREDFQKAEDFFKERKWNDAFEEYQRFGKAFAAIRPKL